MKNSDSDGDETRLNGDEVRGFEECDAWRRM